MSDSINGLGKAVTPPPRSADSAQAEKGAPATPPTARDSDSVNLTETARQLQQLLSAAPGGEAVDVGRVDAVRQTLADGQYTIDSRQVAEQLVQFDS